MGKYLDSHTVLYTYKDALFKLITFIPIGLSCARIVLSLILRQSALPYRNSGVCECHQVSGGPLYHFFHSFNGASSSLVSLLCFEQSILFKDQG